MVSPGLCRSVLALAAALAACSDPATTGRPAALDGALRVAVLLPGPRDDAAWSQAGYQGLLLVERELDAEIALAESVDPAHARDVFRRFAREGYDFVIGHGGEFIPAAEAVAAEFPRVKFAVVAGHPGNNVNLGALSFRDAELGYLCGVIAGLASRTGHVAIVSGVAYPHTRERAVAFAHGARSVASSVRVSVEWVGSWTDAARTRAIARDLIGDGADVLLVVVDDASRAGFDEARAAGVKAMGWSVDQWAYAPETIVTTGIQHMEVLFLEGAMLVARGRWEGRQYEFGLREGAQELAPFRGQLTPEQAAAVERAREDLLSGRVELPRPEP